MNVETHIPQADEILEEWKGVIGPDFGGYRNHVFRVINFCFALADDRIRDRDKVVVSACFHDIGIWPGGNFDYLGPSKARSADYLTRNGLQQLAPHVETMIGEHHKIRRHRGDPLVEAFRRGDLVDLSLGAITCGLPRAFVREVRSAFPNAGFHKCVARTSWKWLLRHPLNPIPVLKL